MGEQFRCLAKANALLLDDILENMEAGCHVIVEQTLYKAKRRVPYIDAIRERFPNAFITVYVMCPSDERWKENIKKRGMETQSQRIRGEREDLEFPNVSEGFDVIYQVTDGVAEPRMDPPKPGLPEQARAELVEEAERMRLDEEDRRRRMETIMKSWIKTIKEHKEGSS